MQLHMFTKLKNPNFALKRTWKVKTDRIICPFNGRNYYIGKIRGPNDAGSQIIFSQRFTVTEGEDLEDRLEETVLQEYMELKRILPELGTVARRLFEIYDSMIEEVKV